MAHSRVALASLCSVLLSGCAAVPAVPMSAAAEAREIMAPSGRLRVGLYLGGPTSAIKNPDGTLKGVGHDIGRELAQRLGVPFEPVLFERNAEVIEAVKAARVDAVFTNATAERMKVIDFSPTCLRIELGYLAPPGSQVRSAAEVDRAGVRVAVIQGGTSDAVLTRELKQAQIVHARSVADGVVLLRAGKADVLASQKANLFEMADQLPGSRVLEGNWGLEQQAIGIPQGRRRALPFLREFAEEAVASGRVRQAAERAGLRGAI